MSIWLKDGLSHITPKKLENPEGFDVKSLLKSMVGDAVVLDYGCGRGRLSSAFDPDRYIGFDINTKALDQASKDNPDFFYTDTLPETYDLAMLYTVALHLQEKDIVEALGALKCDRIIIAEIMRPDMSKPKGIPPAFNRSAEHYKNLLGMFGLELLNEFDRDYSYYPGVKITFQEYSRIGN